MINICIFNGNMSRGGGTERITQILANNLSKLCEYNVFVLNLNNEAEESYYPLDKNISFDILKSKSLYRKIIELFFYLKKKRIDILIDVDVMLGIYSLPALIFNFRTKLVSWEMFNINNNIGSSHTELIRKLCLRKSAYYITQTQGDMEEFKRRMPVKCQLEYIYNPVEMKTDTNQYDTNSKIIVSAGHFFRDKGFDLAVEVGKIVFSKHSEWKWEIYGDGPEYENVKKQIESYGLQNNMVLCGRTKDMPSVYKKASMYVMTSRTEGFGLVLTEAKSYKLPTLSFDIDFGPREIIDHNVSGYLVKSFDVNEMAERILELIEDSEKRVSFAEHSMDNCEKFSISHFIYKWIEVIKKL